MPPIPPVAPALNGVKQGTFVYVTIKDRWPKILTQVIDQVHRYRHTHVAVHPEDGDNDIKGVVHELAEMRYHMATDKPLLNISDTGENFLIWNEQLEIYRKEKGVDEVTWYRTDWLFVECYLYRRIAGSFMKTSTLKQFDPFTTKKQNAYVDSLPAMEITGKYLLELSSQRISENKESEVISRILQICLWGNMCDLSLSEGENASVTASPIEQVDQLADKILINHFSDAVRILKTAEKREIHIVLDNSGLELFGDLALAEFLVSKRNIAKVIFHGKTLPWFVSDVTNNDFCWLIEMLRGSHSQTLSKLGHLWSERLSEGAFEFRANSFWTMPFAYCDMQKYAAELYGDLSKAALIIFKGDLNYRKLVGDREWPLDTPFPTALRGFNCAPLLALRTLKAETQVGLSQKTIEMLNAKFGSSKSWMVTGEYAVAQFNE